MPRSLASESRNIMPRIWSTPRSIVSATTVLPFGNVISDGIQFIDLAVLEPQAHVTQAPTKSAAANTKKAFTTLE